MKNKQHPLILVFYLDRMMMQQPSILKAFSDFVNDTIAKRDANIMAFFIPTDDNERVECINPLIATEEEKGRISEMLDGMTKEFNLGGNLNITEGDYEGSAIKPFKGDD